VTNVCNAAIYGELGSAYYKRGLAELRLRQAFGKAFVFSDDVDWCHDTFKEMDRVTVVGEEHSGPRASTQASDSV
jgi:hypothetical protein